MAVGLSRRDGSRLVKAVEIGQGGRYQLLVWDAAERRAVRGPAATGAHNPAISPDGKTVAYVTEVGDKANPPREVRLWDTVTGGDRVLRPVEAVEAVNLCFSPDGQTLAVSYARQPLTFGRPEFPVEMWDVTSGQRRWQATGHVYVITSLAFSPDGRELATGCWDHWVRFWAAESGRDLRRLNAERSVDRVAFSPDGKMMAVAAHLHGDTAEPGTISLWEVAASRKLEPALQTKAKEAVMALAFAPDGRSLVVADSTRRLRRWEPFARPAFEVLAAHKPLQAWAVAFSPDGKTLATAGDWGQVRLWDADTLKEPAQLKGHTALVSCLAYSPDGRRLATGGYDKRVILWDAAGNKVATCLAEQRVGAVAVSPDGKLLASAGGDNVVRLWDADTGRPVAVLAGHTSHVFALAFSPDGKTLASGETDHTVRLWDVARGETVRVLANEAPIRGLTFSPDGQTLATGDSRGQVKFWRPDTGEAKLPVQAHESKEIRKVIFSPDGRTMATAGMDRCVRLWYADTGHEQLRFADLPHTPGGLAFSPDSRKLAVALHNGEVRVWHATADR
jgi:WD40 repeat protein